MKLFLNDSYIFLDIFEKQNQDLNLIKSCIKNIKDYKIKLKIGDTVVWTNMDSMPHTVTSDSGSEIASSTISNSNIYAKTVGE